MSTDAVPEPAEPALIGPAEPSPDRTDWAAIFGRERPLHVEIGCGRGHFALDFAKANDVNFLAIEQRRSDCDDLRARRDKHGVRNLQVHQGDARLLLPRYFHAGRLEAVHIHCPDPWWKKRHHRRRLVADDFVLELYRFLRPGGELDLRTDVPAYAEVMAETCEDIVGFVNVNGPRAHQPVEGLVLSTRERRYAQTGQPVFRFRYVRPEGPPHSVDVDKAWRRREWIDQRRR